MQDLKVFTELKNTNSVLEKQKILEKYKDSKLVQELLKANLNPFRLFQFNKMPVYETKINFSSRPIHMDFLDLLKKLENREVTGNDAKAEVVSVFERMTKEEAEVYSKVLLKGPIGLTAKTVNKVYPGLIPEFSLMLAPNEIADITKVKYPINVQPKLDGYRCVYHKGAMFSRSGKSFANKHINEYFASVFAINDYTLDGELYAPGYSFNQLQTILNNHEARLPSGLKYFIYDAMPVGDWDAKMCQKPYQARLKLINEVVATVGDHQKVLAISNDLVQTSKEVLDLYKTYLGRSLEGVMLKAPDGLYRWKRVSMRSGEMLKVKPYKTEDLEVTGIYDGEGKYTGMAGGVVVDFNGVAVRCGSGFDDATREAMANAPNDYIGKVAEIRYLEVTEDGSLRHPSFLRWREEKD